MAGGEQTKKLKKVLVGKLAVKANFITQEQLDEVEGLQKRYEEAGKKVPTIGELLAHRGYLTKEQVVALLKGSYSVQQGLFGEIAQRLKFATQQQVEQCLEFQARSQDNGQALLIGQVLVAQGHLRPNQILAVLRAQGKTVARCAACGAAYTVPDFQPGQFTCAACEGVLTEVKDLEVAPRRPSGPATKKTAKPLPDISPGEGYAEFLIENKLGSDPLGDLYLGSDPKKGRSVLVKIFAPSRMLNPTFKKKLLDQAKIASKLDHPHVQRILTMGKSKSCYYLATEYVRGETLQDKLRGRRPLDYPAAMTIFRELVDALSYAHANGLVHGDVRPVNIQITSEGHTNLLNLAIPFDPGAIDWFMSSKGGVQAFYMAPEQAGEQHETDERTDIFNLGCTMYHALTGTAPYKGKSAADLLTQMTERGIPPVRKSNRDVPEETADVVARMLAVEPEDRYQSMKELKQVVDKLPREVQKAVAAIDYAKVLGGAATAPPPASKRAEQQPRRPSSGRMRSAASKSAGGMKAVGKMSYSELVGQLSDEAADAEAEEAARKKNQPKSLIELSGRTASAYRSIETGESVKIPGLFKGVAIGCLVVVLGLGAYIGIKSWLDKRRLDADNARKLAEGSKTPVREPETPPEEIKLKQFAQIEEDYKKAFKLLLERKFDEAIRVLQEQVINLGAGWKRMGDAHNLIGRAFYYKAATDKYDRMAPADKKGCADTAAGHFEQAAHYYKQKDQQTIFRLSIESWMPEKEDKRFWINERIPPSEIHHGTGDGAKKKARSYMLLYARVARSF